MGQYQDASIMSSKLPRVNLIAAGDSAGRPGSQAEAHPLDGAEARVQGVP